MPKVHRLPVHRLPKKWWLWSTLVLTIGLIFIVSSAVQAQGLVEYALILVLVAVVVIVTLSLLGPEIGQVFCSASMALDPASAVNQASCPWAEDAAQIQPPAAITISDIFHHRLAQSH